MIEPKKKRCKGIGKAKGFEGCGEFVLKRQYGLCLPCLREWAHSTGEGQEYIRKMVIPKAKLEVKKKEKAKTKELREKLETKPELEKKLQKEINTIVRLIDKGHPCISSGRPLGKNYDAGHLFSVGSSPEIRFHLFNIWAQSVEQNQHKGGNPFGFVEGLETTFGSDLKEFCLSLKGHPPLNLEKPELRYLISVARGIVKWIELQDREFTTEERIELRVRFTKQLGIYQNLFAGAF